MLIKNKKQLTATKLRRETLEIIEAGINSVLPSVLIKKAVKFKAKSKKLIIQGKKYDLTQSRIFVIGGGKASGLMAQELEKIIGVKNITAGIVNCASVTKAQKIKIVKASHPIPDQKGVLGVEKMLSLKKQYSINKNDVAICLISGGGSALLPCPVKSIDLKDKQKITNLLLRSGAQIQEINIIRKHLSMIKGGQLGKFFAPAKVISLVISDVVGNDLASIASGPTVPDISTFKDAYNILTKYKLINKIPKNAKKYLIKGIKNEVEDTPKELINCHNFLIGHNQIALSAMKKKAKKLGFKPLIITAEQIGDSAKIAKKRASEIIKGKYNKYNVLLLGGETTPTLPKKHGQGGRNQHFIGVSMLAMKKIVNSWAVASINTDGADFLPNVAGAIIDNTTFQKVQTKKINIQFYLKRYDSYSLFNKIGNSLIKTGYTGTNVGDIIIYTI